MSCLRWMFAFVLLTGAPLFGQAVNGSLLGALTDSSGAVVANAKVAVVEQNTGIRRSALTNDSGNYVFPDLPPGRYSVEAEREGFRRAARQGVDVLVNTTVRVDLTLEPGNIAETVNVVAEVAALQSERADTGRTIETMQVADLPLLYSRNFQGLVGLVPGATRPFRPHSEFFNPQDSLSTQVNGQSRLGNNVQLEGIDDNERTGLLQVLIPPAEAIQTVDVTTSNYEAELGRATGAVLNVILKSGTNGLHGQAYWFNRVSALSARAFYDAARGHFVYNYAGGNLGGPIIKNRTFFFGDYLRVMDHRYSPDRYTLPTAAERMGDLSVSPTPIYDPLTGNPDGSGRMTFAGNVIPQGRIDATSKKILSLIPLPNLAGLNQNYFALIPFVRNTDHLDAKVDHNQTDHDRFSVRFSFERPVTTDAPAFGQAGGPHNGGFQGTGVQNTYSGAINYDHIFSPTLIAEVRAGVNRYRNDAQQTDYGTKAAEALGIPGVNNTPFTSGLIDVNIAGFSNPVVGYSINLPWIRAETNTNFVNTWTKTAGNHTIKWGLELRRIRDDIVVGQLFSPRGDYSFGNAQTSAPGAPGSFGNAFASFLLDLPNQAGRDLPNIFSAYRAWQFYSFVQDKWLVTPKLTLDLGLRWEFYPPATPAHSAGFSNYDPAANSLVIAGIGGNPANLGLDTHYKDFAPRVGIAYRATEKMVFRAGFGLSYAPFPDNTYAYNYPVRQNNAFSPNFSFGPAVLPNGQTAAFSSGFPPPVSAVIPSNGIISNAALDQVYNVINKHFREPYVESWNLAVQRALPHNLVLEAAYIGNHGVAQPAVYNLNASQTLGADVAGQPLYQAFGKKASVDLRYQGFSSSYNSLQVKLDHRFSGGFALTTAYTYGKALGYQSEDSGLLFYINPRRNWQRLSFDRRHNFVQSYVYELPFGKGRRWMRSGTGAWIAGGWQVSGVLTIATGTPLSFSTNAASLKAPGNSNMLDHFGPIRILHGTGRSEPWFDPTICDSRISTGCFSQPGALAFGNLGPNVISGPNYWNLDASLFRVVGITERLKLEFRAEGFSVVNTPQWSNPDTSIGNRTFGFITSAGGNRAMQLGLKLSF